MNSKLLFKIKFVHYYSALLALALLFLKWLEFRFIINDYKFEVYIGATAVIFTALGIWLALSLSKWDPSQAKSEILFDENKALATDNTELTLNPGPANQISLSKRELEVLKLMAQGLSNQEIASQLFVSLNTVKTHSSNLFDKMEVRRRTQAIEKAKRLNLIS